jgi:hypothetical protein
MFDINVFYLIPILYVYFFPSILAYIWGHNYKGALWYVNLAIGWTVIGWFACLVWAFDLDGR